MRFKLFFRLILVGTIVVGIMALPFWTIKGVEVKGCKIIPPQEIKKIANVPLGENIFFMRTTKIKGRLQDIAQLKKIRVRRKLPSVILLEVKERKPFAVIVFDDRSLVIDNEGVVLMGSGKWEKGRVKYAFSGIAKLPVVSGLNIDEVKDRKLNKNLAQTIEGSFSVLKKHIRLAKLQLEVQRGGEISLRVEDILKVRLGRPQNIKDKIYVLEALLDSLPPGWENVEYIDVRFPKNPVVKFRG